MYRNSEGYSDPTAGEAISRIINEQEQKGRPDCRKAQQEKKSPVCRLNMKEPEDTLPRHKGEANK